jgi:hypothetical protein
MTDHRLVTAIRYLLTRQVAKIMVLEQPFAMNYKPFYYANSLSFLLNFGEL